MSVRRRAWCTVFGSLVGNRAATASHTWHSHRDPGFQPLAQVRDLYRHEIEQTTRVGADVATNISLLDEVRPHESRGHRPPLAMHRADPQLFQAPGLNDP